MFNNYYTTVDKGISLSLARVYGSITKALINSLSKPSSRHYLRVNTLLISRGELLDLLREKYSEYSFLEEPHINDAIYILVKGPYKVPIVEKKVVVDKNAAESIMLGAPVYRPGVVSFDEFSKGEEVNIVAPNGRIVALARTLIDSLKLKYMKKGIVAENIISLYKLPPIREMEEYKKGYFYPQSLPAMIVSHILDPRPCETILDCCASPGGKTTHLIQLSRGRSKIISIDRSMGKIEKIIDNVRRLRLPNNVLAIPMDARYLDRDLAMLRVDKALIDPPCTGLGVRPKIYIDKTLADLKNSFEYQKQFIKPVASILKENGLLVYSTCTLTFEENELVSSIIIDHGFESIDLGKLPYADKVYYNDVVAYRYHPLNNDMNGYYIAVFKKVSS